MQEEIGLFLNHIALEQNLKPNSIVSYKHDLDQLAEFAGTLGITTWREFNKGAIVSYLGYTNRIGLSAASVARRLSSLRGFFRFLVRERIIGTNPSAHIESPRLYRNLPVVMSVNEVERILNAIDIEGRNGLRDRAALEILYSSGLRISELIGLTTANLFLEVGHLRVTGKGGKERIVPIGEEATHLYAAISRRSDRLWQQIVRRTF